MPNRRRRARKRELQAGGAPASLPPGITSDPYNAGLGWKWRTFPTFAAFAVGGLVPSIIWYFQETTELAFLLYMVFLLFASFCLMHYVHRWVRLKRYSSAVQRQKSAPSTTNTSQ